MDEATNGKKKIAILGGGMASLTAAFELTSSPALRERFDVTVYQLGWRLGGKGASGRNQECAHRIEEHGLHVLMGSYHNTFRLLRACYEELARPAGAPLATLEEAIKPHGFIVAADNVREGWVPWPLSFPPLPGKPGVGAPGHFQPWDYLKKVLAWMYGLFTCAPELVSVVPDREDADSDVDALLLGKQAPHAPAARDPRTRSDAGQARGAAAPAATIDPTVIDPSRLANLIDDLRDQQRIDDPRDQRRARGVRGSIAISAYLYLASLVGAVDLGSPGPRVVWLLERFRSWLSGAVSSQSHRSLAVRRLWILLDLGLTTVMGAFIDGVDHAADGWFSIDDHDLRAWLKGHGASEITCDSALLRAIYNVAFTLPGQAAAGTAIHGVLRMLFAYKEAVFQKMQAGMGDTIFAPLYLVLEKRGVKFELFHRIHELVVSPGGRRIEAIVMGRQVQLKGPAYAPLYDVGGLLCWPSAPRYEQIEGGEALRESGQNLESWWCTWPEAEERRLALGRDFDHVILGLSIGAFPAVCRQLIGANDRFAKMVAHVKTTQTQALQLWLRTDLHGLGWQLDAPVLDGFAEPFDTWADMSHLLPREQWPERTAPRHLAYLCGLLEDDGEPPPPRTAPDYPARQAARVRANAESWLTGKAGGLWPGAAAKSVEQGFDWSLLIDPEERVGARRLEAQYFQATRNPSERYVLSVPGSFRHRLRAGESGFENLVLAGDWVRTGMSAGCIEAAVMAGMQASRALSGHPATIPGDG